MALAACIVPRVLQPCLPEVEDERLSYLKRISEHMAKMPPIVRVPHWWVFDGDKSYQATLHRDETGKVTFVKVNA